jgi:hypothetical protein
VAIFSEIRLCTGTHVQNIIGHPLGQREPTLGFVCVFNVHTLSPLSMSKELPAENKDILISHELPVMLLDYPIPYNEDLIRGV